MNKPIFFLISAFALFQIAFAQDETTSLPESTYNSDSIKLLIEVPFVDFPYQSIATQTRKNFIKSYANPSMAQSLGLSAGLYCGVHYGVKQAFKTLKSGFLRKFLTYTGVAVADYFLMTLPLGTAWLHEEYHRAVLTRRKINSFNDVYKFNITSPTIAVSRLKDGDLANLSDNYKADFRRLQTAGIEGEYHLVQRMQKYNFYYSQGLPHQIYYFLVTLNSAWYVSECATPQIDELIDEHNQKEGSNIEVRDFTGPDFTAWVDALFNPNVPYAARGTHPSGVGINRYIKYADLAPNERAYLKRQGNRQFLNFISPMMIGFNKIKLKSTEKGNIYGNFALRHILTPFGEDVCLDLYYQSPSEYAKNIFFSIHNYSNYNESFMGLEFGIFRQSILKKFELDTRLMLWNQPKNQDFYTTEQQTGGLLGLTVFYPVAQKWYPFAEIEGKTKGWVMGNVFLEENLSFRVGLRFSHF
ncbi:MAG: hypothetical protein NZM38_04595 [Cytophagales bacterium]|nr:hypothetical protein [Cytophagales bacterium]MDW8384032.1 hypothetical protein [Flammeovirgaceae bacterium]